MARNWESWLTTAVGPSSATEQDDRDRTERSIRQAIAASPISPSVRVYAKGSYATNTNVRRDSDVDIVVEYADWMYIDKVNDARDIDWGLLGVTLTEAPLTPSELRRTVTEALVSHFGSSRVDTSGTKAIKVTGGSTTLDADVVPCFRFQRYFSATRSERGTKLYPTTGSEIIGWPEQQKTEGNTKNSDTSRRYKQIIRALKRLENDMLATGRLQTAVAGYFIECLLFNVPNDVFTLRPSYHETAKLVLASLLSDIENDRHRDWAEVNDLKWLWRDGQTWTPEEAQNFAERGIRFLLET